MLLWMWSSWWQLVVVEFVAVVVGLVAQHLAAAEPPWREQASYDRKEGKTQSGQDARA